MITKELKTMEDITLLRKIVYSQNEQNLFPHLPEKSPMAAHHEPQ